MRLIDADELIKVLHESLDGDVELIKDYELLGIDDFINAQLTAYDVDKVVEQCENVAERYADCDEFVCSKCGIHLMEWTEVSIDEDYDDEIHSEYVFKYCPNCGAKIKAGD